MKPYKGVSHSQTMNSPPRRAIALCSRAILLPPLSTWALVSTIATKLVVQIGTIATKHMLWHEVVSK